MQIWRAIVRTLSGSAALSGSATATGSDPLELTDAQLHQVAGGGPKPGAATGGSTPGTLSSMTNGPNGGPAAHPDGGKGGVGGPLN
jgi:hypothetical protein